MSTGGLLGEDLETNHGAYLEKDEIDMSLVTKGNEDLFTHYIQSTKNKKQFNRLYVPLFNFISNIGGVAEIAAFIVTLLYSPITSYITRKNLTRLGFMKKENKVNLLDNIGNPNDPETFEYESVWRLKLINDNLLKPRNAQELKKAKYLKAC